MKHIVVGIFAQVDAGKTTLSEALLYETGQIRTKGRVDHGNAFLDHHSLERSRGITIFSKQAHFETKTLSVTLLDTPGHVDFSPEAERVMPVLDYAILIISGTDGVQPHTQTLWKLLRRYHIPTFLFFNKMDLPGAEKEKLIADAKSNLSESCIALSDSESIALCDESILESFLKNGSISHAEIADLIKREAFYPCLFGAALHGEGVPELLSALENTTLPSVYPESFGARVYKISRDAQGNRLTFLKVTGGSLRVRTMLGEEKITQIRRYSGASFSQIEEVNSGEVCAVLGITALQAGDVIGAQSTIAPPVLAPVMTYRIVLPESTDVRTALTKLTQLEEEDPLLSIKWDERLREIHVQIMGQVHRTLTIIDIFIPNP